ncbi:MAG: hypothetical protein WAV21_02710 [Minisyncoccia bacterium]
MNELILDGETYVSSKRAAEITGYAKDYVGQLCREGRIEARLVGRNWYVLEESVKEHRFAKDADEQSEKSDTHTKKEEPIAWNSPKYMPDIPVSIPTLGINRIHEESSVRKTIVVNDMQRAWQSWFTRKEVTRTENTEETAEVSEELTSLETEIAPQTTNYAKSEEEAVSVPIRHIEDARASVREEPTFTPNQFAQEIGTLEVTREFQREGTDRAFLLRNSFIRIFLAIVIMISIVGGLVGTGYVEEVYGFHVKNIPVLNYIAGIYSPNK